MLIKTAWLLLILLFFSMLNAESIAALEELKKKNIPFTIAALYKAIHDQDKALVKLFINAGMNVAEVRAATREESFANVEPIISPLCLAMRTDTSGGMAQHIIEQLPQDSINKGYGEYKHTILMDVARCLLPNKNKPITVELAKLLIKKGALIDQADFMGRHVLYYAVGNNDELLVRYLIKQGANSNSIFQEHLGEHGNGTMVNLTALSIAIDAGQTDLAIFLMENGADKEQKASLGWYWSENNSSTPLMHAACSGNIKIVSYLLEKGVNVHKKDDYGNTALLMTACPDPDGESKFNILKLLLKSGANVNDKDNYGNTLLHFIINFQERKPDAIELLKKYGVDLNARNNKGKRAVDMVDEKTRLLLLKAGAKE